MKEYEFDIIIGYDTGYENSVCGTEIIKANSEEEAEQKLCELIGTKLYEAFPDYDIEYTYRLHEEE